MSKKLVGFAQSSYDIKHYEDLIIQGEDVEIISIHPYATYYIETNKLPHKIIEDYFSEDERNNIYLKCLAESKDMVNEIDNEIINITNESSLKISNSEYIDADLINPILVKYEILKILKEKLNFQVIYVAKNPKERKNRDEILFYSYMSWFDVLNDFTNTNNIELHTIVTKFDNFDYPYSIFEQYRELIKKYVPNSILMNKFLSQIRPKNIKKAAQSKPYTILFLQLNGPLKKFAEDLINAGYRVLWFESQKSIYSPKVIHLYDSMGDEIVKIDFDAKALKNQFDFLKKNFPYEKMNLILTQKLVSFISQEIWHSYLSFYQFNTIEKRYTIDLIVSLESYQTFLSPILEQTNKNLVLFHGPTYSLKGAKKSVVESFKKINYVFFDGTKQKELFSKLESSIHLTKSFITGNSIYTYINQKSDSSEKRYQILYMTTKLDPNEITFHPHFSNNMYVRDSFELINELMRLDSKVALKFKPISANIGLPELPFYNLLKNSNLDVYTTEITAQELMEQSNIVILDSLGTSLLQAISLDKIIILYNPYKSAIDDNLLEIIKSSVYYCENLKDLFSYIKNIETLTKKNSSYLLNQFAETEDINLIRDRYLQYTEEILRNL